MFCWLCFVRLNLFVSSNKNLKTGIAKKYHFISMFFGLNFFSCWLKIGPAQKQNKRQIKTVYKTGMNILYFWSFLVVSNVGAHSNNSRTGQLISFESVIPCIFAFWNVKILQNKKNYKSKMMRLFLSFQNMNKNARGDREVGESQNMAERIWKFENVFWKILKRFKSGRASLILTNER